MRSLVYNLRLQVVLAFIGKFGTDIVLGGGRK